MCIAQFTYSLARNLINPFFPSYIASFGVSYAIVGAVLASFGMARVFFEIPGGVLIDRFGRRPVILFGLSISLVSHLLGGLAQSVVELVELAVARMTIGVGSAFVMSAGMLLVGELVAAEHRQRSIAQYQSASSIGGIIGPTLGGVLVDIWGIRTNFYAAVLLTLSSILLIAWLGTTTAISTRSSRFSLHILWDAITQGPVLLLSGAAFIMFFTFTSIRGTMVPLYGAEFLALSSTQIGVIYSLTSLIVVLGLIFVVPRVEHALGRPRLLFISLIICAGAVATITVFVVPRVEHALGRPRLLFISLIICAGAVATITVAGDFLGFAATMVPLGVGFSLLQPSPFTMIMDIVAQERRGIFMGILRTTGDLGLILGPLLVGGLLDLGQPRLVFYTVAGTIGSFAVLVWRYRAWLTRTKV
jgi:DHA1 family multidrug resistance protein-like MFS transporter